MGVKNDDNGDNIDDYDLLATLLSTILGQKKGPNFPKLLNFLPYFRSEGKSTVSYKCWMILEGYLWVVRGPYGTNQERVQLG